MACKKCGKDKNKKSKSKKTNKKKKGLLIVME